MAHYIAELMEAATGVAPPEDRAALQRKCFDAILELWNHRSELPNGKRPFEALEPIMRAIESLDPENETRRYFPAVKVAGQEEAKQTQSLLEFVGDLDAAARILIGYTLAEAARTAVDRGKEWVALAENAGADPDVHDIVIRFISEKADVEKDPDPNEWERERLQGRLKRLDSFTKAAAAAAKDLKSRLRTLKGEVKPKVKRKAKATKGQAKTKLKKINPKKGKTNRTKGKA